MHVANRPGPPDTFYGYLLQNCMHVMHMHACNMPVPICMHTHAYIAHACIRMHMHACMCMQGSPQKKGTIPKEGAADADAYAPALTGDPCTPGGPPPPPVVWVVPWCAVPQDVPPLWWWCGHSLPTLHGRAKLYVHSACIHTHVRIHAYARGINVYASIMYACVCMLMHACMRAYACICTQCIHI